MSASSQTSHLAIGEVLSLIQQEFPDVTISKIRFLESQGLIAPERTASGFRKFYESDIERLRWILRQQSDHFLPLKVIKKMIDEGIDAKPGAQLGAGTQPMLWSGAETADATVDLSESKQATGTEDVAGAAAPAAVPETAAQPSRRRPSPTHPSVVATAMAAASSTPPSGSGRIVSAPAEKAAVENNAASAAKETPQADEATAAARTISSPADIVAALQEDPRPSSARRAASGGGRGTRGGRPSLAAEDLSTSGDAEFLSAAEVCENFDVEPSLLAELEKFGLISPRRFGGAESYSEADVEVIGMAVRYLSMGIEPRHLRMYKISAEREAGFIEQLVVPLLKQRNPTARENASERASELAAMGDELRNLILRQLLRDLLGGR